MKQAMRGSIIAAYGETESDETDPGAVGVTLTQQSEDTLANSNSNSNSSSNKANKARPSASSKTKTKTNAKTTKKQPPPHAPGTPVRKNRTFAQSQPQPFSPPQSTRISKKPAPKTTRTTNPQPDLLRFSVFFGWTPSHRLKCTEPHYSNKSVEDFVHELISSTPLDVLKGLEDSVTGQATNSVAHNSTTNSNSMDVDAEEETPRPSPAARTRSARLRNKKLAAKRSPSSLVSSSDRGGGSSTGNAAGGGKVIALSCGPNVTPIHLVSSRDLEYDAPTDSFHVSLHLLQKTNGSSSASHNPISLEPTDVLVNLIPDKSELQLSIHPDPTWTTPKTNNRKRKRPKIIHLRRRQRHLASTHSLPPSVTEDLKDQAANRRPARSPTPLPKVVATKTKKTAKNLPVNDSSSSEEEIITPRRPIRKSPRRRFLVAHEQQQKAAKDETETPPPKRRRKASPLVAETENSSVESENHDSDGDDSNHSVSSLSGTALAKAIVADGGNDHDHDATVAKGGVKKTAARQQKDAGGKSDSENEHSELSYKDPLPSNTRKVGSPWNIPLAANDDDDASAKSYQTSESEHSHAKNDAKSKQLRQVKKAFHFTTPSKSANPAATTPVQSSRMSSSRRASVTPTKSMASARGRGRRMTPTPVALANKKMRRRTTSTAASARSRSLQETPFKPGSYGQSSRDVYFYRGLRHSEMPGNVWFMDMVRAMAPSYARLPQANRKDRQDIVDRIIDDAKEESCHFFALEHGRKGVPSREEDWASIDHDSADVRRRVTHALRYELKMEEKGQTPERATVSNTNQRSAVRKTSGVSKQTATTTPTTVATSVPTTITTATATVTTIKPVSKPAPNRENRDKPHIYFGSVFPGGSDMSGNHWFCRILKSHSNEFLNGDGQKKRMVVRAIFNECKKAKRLCYEASQAGTWRVMHARPISDRILVEMEKLKTESSAGNSPQRIQATEKRNAVASHSRGKTQFTNRQRSVLEAPLMANLDPNVDDKPAARSASKTAIQNQEPSSEKKNSVKDKVAPPRRSDANVELATDGKDLVEDAGPSNVEPTGSETSREKESDKMSTSSIDDDGDRPGPDISPKNDQQEPEERNRVEGQADTAQEPSPATKPSVDEAKASDKEDLEMDKSPEDEEVASTDNDPVLENPDSSQKDSENASSTNMDSHSSSKNKPTNDRQEVGSTANRKEPSNGTDDAEQKRNSISTPASVNNPNQSVATQKQNKANEENSKQAPKEAAKISQNPPIAEIICNTTSSMWNDDDDNDDDDSITDPAERMDLVNDQETNVNSPLESSNEQPVIQIQIVPRVEDPDVTDTTTQENNDTFPPLAQTQNTQKTLTQGSSQTLSQVPKMSTIERQSVVNAIASMMVNGEGDDDKGGNNDEDNSYSKLRFSSSPPSHMSGSQGPAPSDVQRTNNGGSPSPSSGPSSSSSSGSSSNSSSSTTVPQVASQVVSGKASQVASNHHAPQIASQVVSDHHEPPIVNGDEPHAASPVVSGNHVPQVASQVASAAPAPQVASQVASGGHEPQVASQVVSCPVASTGLPDKNSGDTSSSSSTRSSSSSDDSSLSDDSSSSGSLSSSTSSSDSLIGVNRIAANRTDAAAKTGTSKSAAAKNKAATKMATTKSTSKFSSSAVSSKSSSSTSSSSSSTVVVKKKQPATTAPTSRTTTSAKNGTAKTQIDSKINIRRRSLKLSQSTPRRRRPLVDPKKGIVILK